MGCGVIFAFSAETDGTWINIGCPLGTSTVSCRSSFAAATIAGVSAAISSNWSC